MTRPAALPITAALLAFSALLTACDAADQSTGPTGPAGPAEPARPLPSATSPLPAVPPYDAPAGAILADPGSPEGGCAPVGVLVANARNAAPGSTIRIVAYELELPDVVDALVGAHERGVHVQVLVDNRINLGQETIALLTRALGTDRRADSFLVRARGSARGAIEGAQHQKTWLFTQTGRSRWVTLVGSQNLDEDCAVQYNDMYAFVGRRDVHDAFVDVFRQQVRDRQVTDPAREVRLGADRAWFFPGFSRSNDPVQRLLAPLPDAGTRIRVVQLSWSGERGLDIARLLVAKAAGGADVEVLVTIIGDQVRAVLEAGGIDVVQASTDAGYAHNKLILASWTDADGARHRVISTGSDNLGDAPFERDEVVVDVAADTGVARRAWDDYHDYVDGLADRAMR